LREQLPALLFVFGLAAFAVVVWWAITNDAPGVGGGERGLLAMKPAPEELAKRRGERPEKWRRPG
jgi:hypothetical protein